MAKVTDQSIPAEMTDEYDRSLQRSTLYKAGSTINYVRHRYPFRVPHMRNNSVASPSAAQRFIRRQFKACTACFGIQPATGPIPPPPSGPRGRNYWYSESAGSGLFYYDYFMKVSLPTFYDSLLPVWCQQLIEGAVTTGQRKAGGSSYYPGGCDPSWTEALNNYNASGIGGVSPSYPVMFEAVQFSSAGATWAASIENIRRSFQFDLSAANIYAKTGKQLFQIEDAGFVVNITAPNNVGPLSGVYPGPGTLSGTLKEHVTGALLPIPGVAGNYWFGDAMPYLGDPAAVFTFGQANWTDVPERPSCPAAPLSAIYTGFYHSQAWVFLL